MQEVRSDESCAPLRKNRDKAGRAILTHLLGLWSKTDLMWHKAIAEKGYNVVMVLAGGGYDTPGWMCNHGGMSGTLLEVRCLSHPKATDEFINGKPDKYVSAFTARTLAVAAYRRSLHLKPDGRPLGIGVTCALKKASWETEREGRVHEAYMVRQDSTTTYELYLRFDPTHNRWQQESILSVVLGQFFSLGVGVMADPVRRFLSLCKDGAYAAKSGIATLGEVEVVGGFVPVHPTALSPRKAILSSSCNPFHNGHVAMLEAGSRRLGCPVDVELCVTNADKPPLDYLTIQERTTQVKEKLRGNPHFGEVVLTNSPLFLDKLELFPEATFLIGVDTLTRICDPKYYNNSAVKVLSGLTASMREKSLPFLVFPRFGYSIPETEIHSKLYSHFSTLSEWIGDNEFAPTDISSTKIRKGMVDV